MFIHDNIPNVRPKNNFQRLHGSFVRSWCGEARDTCTRTDETIKSPVEISVRSGNPNRGSKDALVVDKCTINEHERNPKKLYFLSVHSENLVSSESRAHGHDVRIVEAMLPVFRARCTYQTHVGGGKGGRKVIFAGRYTC